MADLIAIGYPDETTALSAMDEAERLQHELCSACCSSFPSSAWPSAPGWAR